MSPQPHMLQTSPIGQPPQAGAVDLGTLKTAPDDVIEAAWREQLVNGGFVCQCGQRIYDREETLTIALRRENTIQTPKGNVPGLGGVVVHSLDCWIFLDIYNDPHLQIIAIGRGSELRWFDELPEDVREEITMQASERKGLLAGAAVEAAEEAA